MNENQSIPSKHPVRFAVVSFLSALTIAHSLGGFRVLSAQDSDGTASPKTKLTPAQITFFEQRVRPVLVKRCYDCHSEDSVESKLHVDSLAGLLRGGTRGPAIVAGNPQKSLLISAIKHTDRLQMPPKEKIPAREIVDLTRWVKMGAPWPNAKPFVGRKEPPRRTGPRFTDAERQFWAFQKPVRPARPAVRNQRWVRSPIDAFVLAKLEAKGLRPAPPADRRTLIRRATFDLTGLPPTPREVEAFVSDKSPRAFEKVVDRLLASPGYGERWGRRWLDIARYADSNGMDENLAYANAFRYRDYVVAAFNKDKPYDRFVQEQIAGDLLPDEGDPAAKLEALVATGFLSLGPKMLAEDDPIKMQMDIVDEQIRAVGEAFMGLTLGCARCHDHKFDPIPTADYYSLAGIFKSTKTMENFRVVARWQERPLATPSALARQRAHRQQIDRKKREIKQLTKQAEDRLLSDARKHIADYLIAARNQRRLDDFLRQMQSARHPAKNTAFPGLTIIEAENFTRGNVKRSFSGYGQTIGVIYNKGELPNVAEYDVAVKQAGLYQLQLRLAAAQSRPVKLMLNGKLAKSAAAAKVTGSWFPDTQTWVMVGFFRLHKGINTIRLERDGPFPHFDKLLLVPLPFGGRRNKTATSSPAAGDRYELVPEFIEQWVAYLKKTEQDPHSPFAVWNAFRSGGRSAVQKIDRAHIPPGLLSGPQPVSVAELADRYQQLFNRVEQAWQRLKKTKAGAALKKLPAAQQESLRQILYDSRGPFAISRQVQSGYPETIRKQLQKQRSELKSLERSLPTFPAAMAVSDGRIQDLRIHIRGSHLTLGKLVPRQFPEIIAGEHQTPIGNKQSGRLQLARWLTSPQHPLTSRVMVNRIWQGHFGEGLVGTPDNFGELGARPTHPRLLDWLAVYFMTAPNSAKTKGEQSGAGWSIKKMHRLIMLSATYQMSTTYNRRAAAADPENRLLWRMNRHRLDAEAIRDSILAIAGNLDRTQGGSLLPTANRKYVTSTANVNPLVYDNNRRSIYLPIVRSALYNVFQAFDFADPSVLNGQRINTTVAPQALFMLNSDVVEKQTRLLAQALLKNSALDDAGRVRRLYEQAYSRPSTPDETKRALSYVRRYEAALLSRKADVSTRRLLAWQSLSRAVLASNEFIYVE